MPSIRQMDGRCPDSKRPRILHVVYNLTRGGTEGQCAQTILWLSRFGWEQRVCAFQRSGYYLSAIEDCVGTVKVLPIQHVWHARTWLEVHRLSSFIRQSGMNLVHAWDADAAVFGSLAARWAGVPWFTSRRDLGEIYPPWKLRWMKWADQGAARVVVNAKAIRDKLIREGCPEDKVVHIPNIFDLESFDSQAGRSFPDVASLPEGCRVGMVARLDTEKDVATLLHAMKRVMEKVPKARLLVAGDGVQRPLLESLKITLGLENSVIFLGEVQDVPSLLKQCQVGVLTPKANEGLSNSILEYMAAGLPVVATDCGGNAELVRHGDNGWMVPVGNSPAVAESLVKLLTHPDEARQMGDRGRKRVERDFLPSVVAGRFEALYREARKKWKMDNGQ